MKIGVRILPRKEVLDSQGRALEKTLKHHELEVSQCRVGRYVVLDIETKNEKEALEKAKTMAEFVLYNPLIEDYSLERVE